MIKQQNVNKCFNLSDQYYYQQTQMTVKTEQEIVNFLESSSVQGVTSQRIYNMDVVI